MRQSVIAGNWKMHKTVEEARSLAAQIVERTRQVPLDVILCPPFTALDAVAQVTAGSAVQLGGQDIHWQERGAFTGEVAPSMLVDVGCRAVIIGHSERRQLFGESDEAVARKVRAALDAGLVPIVCVGEQWSEREADETEAKVAFQVTAATAWLEDPDEVGRLIIAYEPIWAIGTGKHADGPTAQVVCAHIRRTLASRFGDAVADRVRILYGGSVNRDNAREFAQQGDIDGALVGGASLDAASFLAIVDEWLAAEERGNS